MAAICSTIYLISIMISDSPMTVPIKIAEKQQRQRQDFRPEFSTAEPGADGYGGVCLVSRKFSSPSSASGVINIGVSRASPSA